MKLIIRVNRKSPESMTRQIREKINEAIDAGTLAAGTLVPSERELAKTAKVARNVVRGAYEQLMSAGKLRSEGRKGRSVKAGGSKKKTSAKRATKTTKSRKEIITGGPCYLSGNIVSRCSHSRVLAPSRPSERISFLITFRSASNLTKNCLLIKKNIRTLKPPTDLSSSSKKIIDT